MAFNEWFQGLSKACNIWCHHGHWIATTDKATQQKLVTGFLSVPIPGLPGGHEQLFMGHSWATGTGPKNLQTPGAKLSKNTRNRGRQRKPSAPQNSRLPKIGMRHNITRPHPGARNALHHYGLISKPVQSTVLGNIWCYFLKIKFLCSNQNFKWRTQSFI